MLGIYRITDTASLPTKSTEHSACYDIFAHIQPNTSIKLWYCNNNGSAHNISGNSVNIPAQTRALIPTGIIFSIPSGYSVRIHPRSGLALKHGISLANAEGIIDSDYYHETFICIVNTSEYQYTINHGDKIAQIELVRELDYEVTEISEIPTRTTDRTGGFGHTGK